MISVGTSTLGRPKKSTSLLPDAQLTAAQDKQSEIESSQSYLELPDPDTHILVFDTEQREDNYKVDSQPAELGKVRHWSDTDILARPGIGLAVIPFTQ